MKKLILLAAILFGCNGTGPSSPNKQEPPGHSGCCSHHNGVCGCDGLHAVCCDGTVSKSCGCD